MPPSLPGRFLAEAEEMFGMLASMRGDAESLSSEDLIECHGADYRLFEKLDANGDSKAVKEEWIRYLSGHYAQKEAKGAGKGDHWWRDLSRMLREGHAKFVAKRDAHAVSEHVVDGVQPIVALDELLRGIQLGLGFG